MDMAIAAELLRVAEVLKDVCRVDEAARAEVVMAGGWTLNSLSFVFKVEKIEKVFWPML